MDALRTILGGASLELGVATVAAMVAIVAAAAGVRALLTSKRSEVVERLERTVGRADAGRERPASEGFSLAKLLQPIARIARPTKASELTRLRQRMVQAGYRTPMAVETFLALKLGIAAILTIAFLQINKRLPNPLTFPMDLALAVWICGAGFLLPNLFVGMRIRDRQTQIERGLPDAMDLLVTCVEAGLGLDAAISRVAEEIGIASPLLGAELNLTFLEVQAGVPRPDAFRKLAERTGVEDLRSLSAMLIQTEMFGTSVAKALRVHADGMRVKRMQRAEEKAAMVGVKMTIPLVLCILPSLIAVLLGPSVVSIVSTLFTTMEGQ